MVRKAISTGMLSGLRKISASKIKEMTGTARMAPINGRSNASTLADRAIAGAIAKAAMNEIKSPRSPRPIVANRD